MYYVQYPPVVCCVLPIFVVVVVLLISRSVGIFIDDRDYTCTGRPMNIRIVRSTRANHNGWYLKYYVYFNSNNPEECYERNNMTYSSKVYRTEELAFNISKTYESGDTFIVKRFPTETREFLNLTTFLLIFVLTFGCLMSCNSRAVSEKQRLLSHV